MKDKGSGFVPNISEARKVWAVPNSLAATTGMKKLFVHECRWNGIQEQKSFYFFLFLLLLRCFTSEGSHIAVFTRRVIEYYLDRVSPFGHRRIKGCSPPPRRLSQARYVLHRFQEPRHPPCALITAFCSLT